ncbi:hypothetical protein [Butyrivibrio sp. X503]|uniref:hypothetical protein n=1 Tax=Butyrivibrio sp. X503 TaxID=2364878 RepID=UPI0011C220AB|nr:hypothetical protein [Butyrivibrio sp. X503]
MKKRFLRITSLLAMAVFFMASYVEATAQSDVSLPVDVGGMEKYGYDFTGFSMDKESLLTMIDASIKGLNKAISQCDDEKRKSELQGRVDALTRAYDVVSASDKERYFLTDEEGNLITGSGSLYKILGYMRGGVESLEIDAEWDMTPREIVISGNGNSALVFYKDGKFYSDREAETEVFNVGDVGGRIVTSDSSEGHYKGVYLASGLELVDTDGNLIIDDDLASAIEAELKLTAAADYYLHLQVIRSDGVGGGGGSGNGGGGSGGSDGSGDGDVKEGPIDFYFYGDTLYHDLDYTDRADSIDIPSSEDEEPRTWALIDMITDAFGESYIYSLVELRPVIGERVTDIEVIEPEDDSDDSDSGDDSASGDSEAGAGSDDGGGSGADGSATSDDDSSDEELIPTIIVHTEDYLQGYVATNRDDSAIFVVSADGSIDYDNTDIDEETVDVDSIKEETLARWLEEKEAERRAAEEEKEEEAAAAASSGLSIEDAAAVASSDEAGLASSDESDEAGLAASEGASGPSDAANEGMSGDGAGTGDAIGDAIGDEIGDSAGTGAGNEDAAGSDQLGGEGNGDGNDDALAGGNDGGDNNDDALAGGNDGGDDNDDTLDNSGDDGNDDSGSGDDAGDSGDSGDDGDDDDGGESISEDAAPTEEYHGDEGDSGDGGSGDGDGDDSE